MRKIFKLLLCCIALASCSTEPPVFVDAKNMCNDQYKDKTVTTEGVIVLPTSFYTVGDRVTMSLQVEGAKGRIPCLNFKTWGDKKNIMEPLKDGYTEDDVTIYDKNGKKIPLGSKVRVTGELEGGSQAWCEIAVETIEEVNN